MRLALRIEVGTEAGARKGVPALLRLLDEYQIKASFLFSLGPDYRLYPFAYTLPNWIRRRLPVPYIGKKHRDTLRAVADAGHDIGVSGYTAVEWADDVAFKPHDWLHRELQQSMEAFQAVFGKRPQFYGAPHWQVSEHLFAEEASFGFDFATDVRGKHPFLPALQGVRSSCPQLPTTLPLLDELYQMPEVTQDNLHQYLFAECQRVLPMGEVFSLSAEREGRELLPVFERLLVMWRGGQWEIHSLSELFEKVREMPLKYHQVGWAQVDGDERYMAMQSTLLD